MRPSFRILATAGPILAAALAIALLATDSPAGAAPAADSTGLRMVVTAADPLAPAIVLTNGGSEACQVTTVALGTVGITRLTQAGAAVAPVSTDPSFPDSVDVYLATRLRTLAPGASTTIRLPVVAAGPTGHAIETVTWSSLATMGALYPIASGKPLQIAATYAPPPLAVTGAPMCDAASAVIGTAGPIAAGHSYRRWIVVVGVVVVLLLLLLLLFVLRRRRRATPAAALVLIVLAGLLFAGAWPARAAFATVTVDPSLAKDFAKCQGLYTSSGGDPASLFPILNDPKSNVKIVPSNGDQTHEISFQGQVIIFWNTNDHHAYTGGGNSEPCDALYHEAHHGKEDLTGGQDHSECVTSAGRSGLPINEVDATRAQNMLRVKEGLPQRKTYGDTPLPSGPCLPKDQQPKPKSNCTGPACGDDNGDPHLITFDGLRYDFQAAGEFVAARDTTGPDLQVQVRQQPLRGSSTVSVNTAVAMAVAGDKVEIDVAPGGMQMLINGADVPLDPADLPHGGSIAIDHSASAPVVTVDWPDGSFAVVNMIGIWGLHLTTQLAPAHAGKMVGLLGNANASRTDDLKTAAGAVLTTPPSFSTLYPGFADSWRVTQATSLFTYPAGASTATYTDRSFPHQQVATLTNTDLARTLCQRVGITDPVTLANCVLDVAETGQASFAEAALATQTSGAIDTASLPTPGPTTSGTLSPTTREATLTVTKPNGFAEISFTATPGQRAFIAITSSTVPSRCGVIDLIGPDGIDQDSGCTVADGTGSIGGDILATSGPYKLRFTPVGGTIGSAHVKLILSNDVHAAMPTDGSPVTADITAPGQVNFFSFTGTAGERVYVSASASTGPDGCGSIELRAPSGLVESEGCILDGAGYIDGTLLKDSGQYAVAVDPADAETGSVVLRLITSRDVHGTVTVGGAPVTAKVTAAGQVADYAFTATKGEKVKIVVSDSTLVNECGPIVLVDPKGIAATEGCVDASGHASIDPFTLNEAGRWVLRIDPPEDETATVTFSLRAG